MTDTSTSTPPKRQQNSHLFVELIVCVILPTVILKYLSPEERLGPVMALIFGLSLPLLFGLRQFWIERKFGFIPALGFISILLTSGIGLLQLDPKYIAIKEAAIPLIIGVGTIISLKTPYPLVKTFIYNDKILQIDKVDAALAERNNQAPFDYSLKIATYILASSFLLSAILNYALAKYIVKSPAGTAAFNDELGTMNLLSYPVITIPCVIVMIYAMMYLFRQIKKLTGLDFEEIIHH
ncbi:MAG: VC0807 family protein [Oleiphilaceae bacterium]|nr:VC0807 family protein [Oleiphilaceae bacterium]